MKHLGMEGLIGEKIFDVSNIIVVENQVEEQLLDDSLLLKNEKGFIHIFISENHVELKKFDVISDIMLWDYFDRENIKIKLELLTDIKNGNHVKCICNYYQGTSYHFGAKCLDEFGDFVVGFCYGFDELIYQDEFQFQSLLSRYSMRTEVKII